MVVGKFNETLQTYDDEYIRKAYEEVKILEETGSFPADQKYFHELCDLRNRLYQDGKNIDATKRDLMCEITRRWYEKQQNSQKSNITDRKVELLIAAYNLLNKQKKSQYVLNLLSTTVHYDDAECDGSCLMEDIENCLFEEGIDVTS